MNILSTVILFTGKIPPVRILYYIINKIIKTNTLIAIFNSIYRIKKLGKFHHCSTQINDIMMYTIRDADVLSEVIPGTNLDSTINELNNARCNTQPDVSNGNTINDGLNLLSVPVPNGTGSSSGEVTAECKDGDIPEVCSGDNDSGVCTKSEALMNGHDDEEDVEMDDSLDMSEITANESQIGENNDDADYEDVPDQTKEKRKRMQKRSAKGKRKKKKTMEFQTKFPTYEVGDSVAVVVYCTMSLATVMWQVNTNDTTNYIIVIVRM